MDVASFSAVIAAVSVVVGVVFFIFQMHDAAKTRHTGLVIQLNPALNVPLAEMMDDINEIWRRDFTDFKEYLEKYGEPLSDKALFKTTMYYDGLGFLLHKGLIEVDTIEYLVSGSSVGLWEKLELIIEGTRKHYNMPELFKWFEYLNKEIGKRE